MGKTSVAVLFCIELLGGGGGDAAMGTAMGAV